MARKKKHPEHVNHERWLISYADFITLLFAFFVVMFAVSQVDSAKVGRFTESFTKAVGIDMFPESGQGLMPGGNETNEHSGANKPKPAVLPSELEDIKAKLSRLEPKDELPNGLQVLDRRSELVIRLSEGLIFAPGDDTLKEPAMRALDVVAKEIGAHKVDVRIEGHTDDRPIKTVRFRSNWDLSTARSTAVVAALATSGIPPERLSAAGYGEFHPIAANATDDGRRQNRRVDIVLSVTNPGELVVVP